MSGGLESEPADAMTAPGRQRLLARLTRANGPPARGAWLALVLGLFLILPALPPDPPFLVLSFPVAALVAVLASRRTGAMVIVALAVAGIGLRVAAIGVGSSDVLSVTSAAIERLMGGQDPYGAAYAVSRPPGAPFPYGPLALLWYLPARAAPGVLEFLVSAGIVVALALRGRPLGLALFALTPTLVISSVDGSNDTSAGLILLVAVIAARRSPMLGGIGLAAAVAFKLYALAWLPAFVAFAGWRGFVGFAGASLVFWIPPILAWGVRPIVDSMAKSQSLHPEAYRSLARLIQDVTGERASQALFDRLRLALGAATAVASFPLVKSARSMIVAGAAVFLVTLYAGYWSTLSYLAAIAPVICWYLDEWVGLGSRAVFPGDPAGRLASAIDRRWPALAGTGRH